MTNKKKVMSNKEYHQVSSIGSNFRDIILGGQDGVVNVLGVVLTVAAATNQIPIIIISGIAANIAESLSMAAVAYTSTKADRQYYQSQLETENREIKEVPNQEKKEIYDIYYSKGFRGNLLNQIVKKIISSKKLWIETMMTDELGLANRPPEHPAKAAFIVGVASLVGSTIPLLPFFFLSVKAGIIVALIISTLALFATGALKAKFTIGSWLKNGFEMSAIGILTALVGYFVGTLLGKIF